MAQAAVKIEPKGEWLSESEIAKRCGIHRQTLASRLEELGYDPDVDRSTPLKKVHWFNSEMEFAVKAAKDSLAAAKIRGVRLDNEKKEIQLAEAKGELVPMKDAVEIAQQLVGAIYQEYTVRSPKRIATKLAKAKNVTEIKKILKADSDRIMKQLRENFERFLDQA